MNSPLQGQRVLVLEDDYFVAMDTSEWLARAGADVVGPVATAQEACALLSRERVDAAVLDVNLGDGPTFEVPDRLKRQGVPFLFTTGYDQAAIPGEFKEVPRVEKPFNGPALVRALRALR